MIFRYWVRGGEAPDKTEVGWVPIPALGWVSATHEKKSHGAADKINSIQG